MKDKWIKRYAGGSVLALALLLPAAPAFASPPQVTLTLQPPVVSGAIVTFTGTLLDTGANPITAQYLTDSFQPVSLDDSPFVGEVLLDSPFTFQPGTPVNLTLFNLNTTADTPGSTVSGYFDIVGVGANGGTIFDTGDAQFSYKVPGSAGPPPSVPEPSGVATFAAGAGLLAFLGFARRAWRRREAAG